jgi:hypothetical protein
MAGEPLDSLDEFFDFAQLEEDNNVYAPSFQYEALTQAVPVLGPDSAMDWQPTITADMGAFHIPSEISFHIPEEPMPNFYPAVSMLPLVQDIPAVSQLPSDDHTGPLSYPWEQHRMPQEGEVITLRQEVNQTPRPQRSNTVTRKPASAKRKGPSTRLPEEARQILEEEFAANSYPCSWEIDIIAHQANLDVKRVRNWFNNTRARKKPESPGSLIASLPHA